MVLDVTADCIAIFLSAFVYTVGPCIQSKLQEDKDFPPTLSPNRRMRIQGHRAGILDIERATVHIAVVRKHFESHDMSA